MDDLRARLAEAEETLRAIRSGEADALVIAGSQGDEVHFLGDGQSIYRRFIEAAHEGTATLSADGVVLSCDTPLATTLGRRVDQIVGTDMTAYLSADDRDALLESLAQSEGGSRRRRVRLIAGSGDLVPVYLAASTLHGPEEQQVSCVVLTDLEEVVSAEEALRESAERYRELIQLAPVGIGVIADDRIAFANAAALRLLGAESAEQVVGSPLADIMHPASLEDVRSRIRGPGPGERDLSPASAICLRLDGTCVDVEIAATPVSFGGVAAIQVVLVDVTERRRAEGQLVLAAREWQETFDAMRDSVAVFDAESRVTRCNSATSELTGRAPEGIIGGHCHEVFHGTHDHHEGCPQRRAFASGRAETSLFEQEGKWLRATFVPRMDESGEIMGGVHVVSDVTELKQAERQLLESVRKQAVVTDGVIAALARSVEVRDLYTAGHQRRVSELAVAIAQQLGLDEERVRGVQVAGKLHDVGKSVIPAEILSRPGHLSAAEFELIKAHTQAGFDVLYEIEFVWPVAEIALQHHERLDGSGYPAGLSGEAILLEARILAVADVIEAMISHRPYRAALPLDDAIAEIEDGAGRRYDAAVCEVAVRLLREGGFTFSE